MPYLTDDDLREVVSDYDLEQALTVDPTVTDEQKTAIKAGLIARAEAEANTYLAHRFLTSAEYAYTGDARNAALKGAVLDLFAFHVHKRISPRNVPETREKAYLLSIAWLKDAQKGNITLDVPIIDPAPIGSGRAIVVTSSPQRCEYGVL